MKFELRTRIQPVGKRKGQQVYYAQMVTPQRLSVDMLTDRIVRETSLSPGDVRSALISLSHVVCEALADGMSVDLAELGRVRLTVPGRMMDSEEDVTPEKALKTPRIVFTPKQRMRKAANSVSLHIDRGYIRPDRSLARLSAAAPGQDGEQAG